MKTCAAVVPVIAAVLAMVAPVVLAGHKRRDADTQGPDDG